MTHTLEISELDIATGPHCAERNLYDLLILGGAPVVIERNWKDHDQIRYRSLQRITRDPLLSDKGNWVFRWEDK